VYEQELMVAGEAARAAAAVVLRGFGKATTTEFKGDANPVTAIDRAAEVAALAVIRASFPADAIVAEESADFMEHPWEQGRAWLVDPLDGTVNFIHSVPQIAVSVALWVQGQPATAVIRDVITGEEFTAVRDGGAWRSPPRASSTGRKAGVGVGRRKADDGGGWRPVRDTDPRRLAVSNEKELAASLLATGFPYDRNQRGAVYARNLGDVLTRSQGVRRFGSAALDLAWVADGRYDGYWEFGLSPWDAAGGVLIVAEAGGRVSTADGDDYRLGAWGLVASNGRVHDDLLAAIQISMPSPPKVSGI
jgi:myo-inositol-1(or 4)-monophosphatase